MHLSSVIIMAEELGGLRFLKQRVLRLGGKSSSRYQNLSSYAQSSIMSSIVQDCKYSGYLFSFLIFHTGDTFLIFLPALQRDFFIMLDLLYMCAICNTCVQVPDFNEHTTTRSFL